MSSILFAGFEPFGGETINPSAEAVARLGETPIAGHAVVATVLPVTFAGAFPALREAAATHQPGLILLVGQAAGRAEISIERVALNLADAERPDNDGATPVDEPIAGDGPAALISPLPLRPMVDRLRDAGIPARISNSAGTYVCNHVFYSARHGLGPIPVGLIHIPYAPEQCVAHRAGTPSMATTTVVQALRIAATVALLPDGADPG